MIVIRNTKERKGTVVLLRVLIHLIICTICNGFCWTKHCESSTSQTPSKSPIEWSSIEIQTNAPSRIEVVSSMSSSEKIIIEASEQQQPVQFAPKYTERPYKFALIPKLTINPFFGHAFAGCEERASKIEGGGVECIYVGPAIDDPVAQSELIYELVDTKAVQGIAISVSDANTIIEAINYAIEAGVPVVTFDSDAPDSNRLSYIGTDNFALGEQLAKVLMQLDPTGDRYGKYGFVSANGPNLAERVKGFRSKLHSLDAYKVNWEEVSYSPTNCYDQIDVALQQMYEYADDPNIRAIIPVGGWPMWNETGWKEFVNTYRNRAVDLKLVVADSLPVQIELLNKGYVNGLVGQLPYQMGEESVQALFDINEGKGASQLIYGTNLLQVLQVPLIFPDVNMDMNFIGNAKYLGYLCFAVIVILSISFAVMSLVKSNARVIRASQPFFLVMICIGVFILGSTIIPASIDSENHSQKSCDISCMCIPWLFFIGFTTTFSALFSKTWRINQVIRNASRFKRVKVTVKDVMLPFVIIMFVNLIVLITWTIVSPLKYQRFPDEGTDPWNRVIATYGTCTSTYSNVFAGILFFISLILLIIANVQAYQARCIRTEFSESKYIAVAVAAILQAMIVGAPVLILSNDQPQTKFLVLCLLIFVTCTAVLLLILGPKAKTLIKPSPKPQSSNPAKNRWSEKCTFERQKSYKSSTGENGLKVNAVKSLHIKLNKSSKSGST